LLGELLSLPQELAKRLADNHPLMRRWMMRVTSRTQRVISVFERAETAQDPENLDSKLVSDIRKSLHVLDRRVDLGNLLYIARIGTLPGFRQVRGRSSFCKRNAFMESSILRMGGSVRKNLNRFKNHVRYGGGLNDAHRYLSEYDKNYDAQAFRNLSTRRFARFLGIRRGMGRVLGLDEVLSSVKINLDANPGPSYKVAGYEKKLDAINTSVRAAELVVDQLAEGLDPAPPLYSLAGRPKLTTMKKALEKLRGGRPVGRAVMMADAHETLLASRFSQPMLQWAKESQKVIMLGYNKYAGDVTRLTSELVKYNTYLTIDFSRFDSTVSSRLIHKGFNVIANFFGLTDENPEGKLLRWLESQFTNSVLVTKDGVLFQKSGGVPSGSALTSLVDSLCSAYVMWTIMEGMKQDGQISGYDLRTYGDDVLLSVHYRGPDHARRKKGRALAGMVSAYAETYFGMSVSAEDTRVCCNLFVQYAVPNVPGHILDRSSVYMRAYHRQQEKLLGRRLTFNEKWMLVQTEPKGPFVGGTTHRWTYVFWDSPDFLSYYFHENGSMIRPTSEVIDRILNPESPVMTLDAHINHLMSALVENANNDHTINHVMHYMLDAWYMSLQGITNSSEARRDIKSFYHEPDRDELLSVDLIPEECEQDMRFWYRWQTKVADLRSDDRTKVFLRKFDKVVARARRAHHDSLAEMTGGFVLRNVARRGHALIRQIFMGGDIQAIKEYGLLLKLKAELFPQMYNSAVGEKLITLAADKLRVKRDARSIVGGKRIRSDCGPEDPWLVSDVVDDDSMNLPEARRRRVS
jgi:hypothetical protein